MRPVVAIVGRPNVGKSTLFNRILGRREAIVSPISGTTRDRKIASVSISGREFLIIDTAGILPPKSKGEIEEAVNTQIEMAIESAAVIVFLVDAKEGLQTPEEAMARKLKRSRKKVVLAANKTEGNVGLEPFYALGFGKAIAISAIHGNGVSDLLETVAMMLPAEKEKDQIEKEELIDLAIVGRPNVGKSTILNQLSGSNRALVTSIPGTTRDTVDAKISYKEQKFRIVDTAGIRKRGKIGRDIEYYSVLRAIRAMEEADLCLLVLDAERGLAAQDLHLAGLINEMRLGVVLAVNKWDVKLSKESPSKAANLEMARWLTMLEKRLPFLDYAPVVFLSAKEKKNFKPLLNEVLRVSQNRPQPIDLKLVDEIVNHAKSHHPALPPKLKLRQDQNQPNLFKIAGIKRELHFSLRRYIINELRDSLEWPGWPIIVEND